MSRLSELYCWMEIVASHFPQLSKAQASGLALWSFGMIIARSCALSSVAGVLEPVLGQSFYTVRERLRDTYREASAGAFQGKEAQLACTLLGYWGQGYKETWLVLTDLPPNAAQVCWYSWRAWIEQGFKHLKKGGWQ